MKSTEPQHEVNQAETQPKRSACTALFGTLRVRDGSPTHIEDERGVIVATVWHDLGGAYWGQPHPNPGFPRTQEQAAEIAEAMVDSMDARGLLERIMPFVLEDYYPDYATPEFKEAVESATAFLKPNVSGEARGGKL